MREANKRILVWTLLGLSVVSFLHWLLVPSGATYAGDGIVGVTGKAFFFTFMAYAFFNFINLRSLLGFRLLSVFFGKKKDEAGRDMRPEKHLTLISIFTTLSGLAVPVYVFFYQSRLIAAAVAGASLTLFLLVAMFVTTEESKQRAVIKEMAEKKLGKK